MSERTRPSASSWRTVHGDLTDSEWELIADLVQPWWRPGTMGRPATVDRRRVVDAILYVAATGCQWRALPAEYPNWNTVHRLHLQWSKDGTWEKIADRLRRMLRERDDRDGDPSGTVVDARSARGASTVTGVTRGYDAGKKISGRKTFGIVDTLGLLLAVVVVAGNTSDNAGGIEVVTRAKRKSPRLAKVWHDAGFKTTFRNFCAGHHVSAEVVKRIHPHEFVVLPRRWVIERSWSWLMNHRRLQLDYERRPDVTEGFIWAASSRLMLRQLAPT